MALQYMQPARTGQPSLQPALSGLRVGRLVPPTPTRRFTRSLSSAQTPQFDLRTPQAQVTSIDTSKQEETSAPISLSPLEEFAMTAIKFNTRFSEVRDSWWGAIKNLFRRSPDEATAKERQMKLERELAHMDGDTARKVETLRDQVMAKARELAGISSPDFYQLGYFDPIGFSITVSTGKLLFFREVKEQHGNVEVLTSLGILVGDQYVPLSGGNVDDALPNTVPSHIPFQETPLQAFWPAVVAAAIAIPEVYSIFDFGESMSEIVAATGLIARELAIGQILF
jgi:hypothetical protein